MACVVPEESYQGILINIFGCTNNQCQAWNNECPTINDREHLFVKQVQDWCLAESKLTTARDGVVFALSIILNLQSLCFWHHHYAKRGRDININNFNHSMIIRHKQMVSVEDLQKAFSSEIDSPPKLTANVELEN